MKNLLIIILVSNYLVQYTSCQTQNAVVKLATEDDYQRGNAGLNKFENCLVSSKCDDNNSCKAQTQYCRIIYCDENKKIFHKNDYKMQNSHANCVEFCLNKLFLTSFVDEVVSFLECLFSKNDNDTFFKDSGYKSKYNYFSSYKPKIQLGISATGQSSFVEEFFLKRNFEITNDIHQNSGQVNDKFIDINKHNVQLKWNIEDESIESRDHCHFVSIPSSKQTIHRSELFQINHPIQFVSLLTRKDCLKKILKEFDQTLTQSCNDQDQDQEKDSSIDQTTQKKCVLLFSSKKFLQKSFYIDTKKEISLKEDDSHYIINAHLKSNIKYVLKPTKSSYGTGLKFVRDFEEFQKQFISMNQKSQKLIFKEYILEEFLDNQLILDDRNVDLSFYVTVISTSPQLVYAKKGYARVNGYKYKTEANSTPSHHVFNSRFFEVAKSAELKGLEVDNQFYNFEEFFEMLVSKNISSEQKNEKVIEKCYAIITYSLYAYANQFTNVEDEEDATNFTHFTQFSVLRFDFLLDSDLNPYLLEVDGNPLHGDHLSFEQARQELNILLQDTIDYVDALNRDSVGIKDLESRLARRKSFISKNHFEERNPQFQLLINDATDFIYLTDVFEI